MQGGNALWFLDLFLGFDPRCCHQLHGTITFGITVPVRTTPRGQPSEETPESDFISSESGLQPCCLFSALIALLQAGNSEPGEGKVKAFVPPAKVRKSYCGQRGVRGKSLWENPPE